MSFTREHIWYFVIYATSHSRSAPLAFTKATENFEALPGRVCVVEQRVCYCYVLWITFVAIFSIFLLSLQAYRHWGKLGYFFPLTWQCKFLCADNAPNLGLRNGYSSVVLVPLLLIFYPICLLEHFSLPNVLSTPSEAPQCTCQLSNWSNCKSSILYGELKLLLTLIGLSSSSYQAPLAIHFLLNNFTKDYLNFAWTRSH